MKENGWEVEVKHCHGDFGPLRKTLKAMGALPQIPWEEEDTYYRSTEEVACPRILAHRYLKTYMCIWM